MTKAKKPTFKIYQKCNRNDTIGKSQKFSVDPLWSPDFTTACMFLYAYLKGKGQGAPCRDRNKTQQRVEKEEKKLKKLHDLRPVWEILR